MKVARTYVGKSLQIVYLVCFSSFFWTTLKFLPPSNDGGSNHFDATGCTERLDKLEERFNQRRKARIDALPGTNLTKLSEINPSQKISVFDAFEPEASCFAEERFGSKSAIRFNSFGDGPKFICGVDNIANKEYARKQNFDAEPSLPCLVYSVGSKNEIEFEKAVHHFLGCETHTFDPTLEEEFKGHEYAVFHPWGIGLDGEQHEVGKHSFISRSLQTIIAQLGHTKRTIDILKIDCEGCEYRAMPLLFDLIAKKELQINQIQIELHETDFDQVTKFFEAGDKAGMRIFHKERNAWGCQGYLCVEYSLITESFLREVNKGEVCG
ncbi:unnamed protein product [Cylindrotheca closterium]|uniref:Methyltransferase domain-containing protein n=1 Tax=Cylindrotheca closterium TaxID=2856 RepID=A0AAD2CL14_9STRA|nr:unnamed protein product [Cylindrotheca closterium]CAJ1945419.1 unnamed protein product [Cylindrotheca closterium]